MARDLWQPVKILGKGPWSLLPAQTWSLLTDFFIFAAGLSLFYGVVVLARTWFGPFNPTSRSRGIPGMLPVYAAYSLTRIVIAYFLSLAFTLVYGYVAAYNVRAERIMIPLLDILQSIPVLSFLPGVMLAMVALFPHHQLGVELGAILLIFTGQVWNMAFSFYSSLKSIPREMREAAEDLPLQRVPAIHAARSSLRCHRFGVELDDVGRRRLVLPDGVRDVRPRLEGLSPAGAGIVLANRRQCR